MANKFFAIWMTKKSYSEAEQNSMEPFINKLESAIKINNGYHETIFKADDSATNICI